MFDASEIRRKNNVCAGKESCNSEKEIEMDKIRNDELLCIIFSVSDPNFITKTALQKAVIAFHEKVNDLMIKLFCVDPKNEEFNDLSNKIRNNLLIQKQNIINQKRKERLKRLPEFISKILLPILDKINGTKTI
jgi:regulator of PEP synthase PpsR (kinase-PPPase family)